MVSLSVVFFFFFLCFIFLYLAISLFIYLILYIYFLILSYSLSWICFAYASCHFNLLVFDFKFSFSFGRAILFTYHHDAKLSNQYYFLLIRNIRKETLFTLFLKEQGRKKINGVYYHSPVVLYFVIVEGSRLKIFNYVCFVCVGTLQVV